MQLTYVLTAALGSLALTTAFVIPTGLEDGLYRVTKFDNGSLSDPIQLVKGHPTKRDTTLIDLTERSLPDPQETCAGHYINTGDFVGARANLNAWCNNGNWVNGNSYYWWSSNSAQAYICNYSGNSQPCSSGEYDESNSLMDLACGSGTAAWVYISDWAKVYGRDNSGVSECF